MVSRHTQNSWDRIPLARDYLRPGEHTVGIRLTARSTTTYWLLEARLEFTPEAG
jgi:hypothetical protein